MQSIRTGGYYALPKPVRMAIVKLTTKTDKRGKKKTTLLLVWPATLVVFPFFFSVMLVFAFAPMWLQEKVSLSHLHAFSDFGFFIKHDAWSGMLGLFLGGALGYSIGLRLLLLLPNANRISAQSILYTHLGVGDAKSEANRDLQNYVLDRTPADDPSTFPKRYTQQYIEVIWYWCRPALIVYAVWACMDINTYKTVTVQGLTSSSFLQVGKTFTPWHEADHVQVGCHYAFEDKAWRIRPRYHIYFSNGRSIDLFGAQYKKSQLEGIEEIDAILKRDGVRLYEAHVQKKLFKHSDIEMQIECESAMWRSQKYDTERTQHLLNADR